MYEKIIDELLQRIDQVTSLYNRLILLVAPSGRGKSSILQALQQKTKANLINLGLELSQQLLEFNEKQRALQVNRLISNLLNTFHSDLVLLDNTEILFQPSLQLDPLRLLQKLSRDRTIVAAWNGCVKDGHLIYAAPEHPEYRRYPILDLIIITMEDAND